MELNKFGAILKFALALEQRAAEFYEDAIKRTPSPEYAAAAAVARKHLTRLERMRRELINEMLLEPIRDFEQPDVPSPPANIVAQPPSAVIDNPEFTAEGGCATMDAAELVRYSERLRAFRRDFYRTAAAKIEIVSPAVSHAFVRMAEALANSD